MEILIYRDIYGYEFHRGTSAAETERKHVPTFSLVSFTTVFSTDSYDRRVLSAIVNHGYKASCETTEAGQPLYTTAASRQR